MCKVDLKDICMMRHLTVTTRMHFAVNIFVMQICAICAILHKRKNTEHIYVSFTKQGLASLVSHTLL